MKAAARFLFLLSLLAITTAASTAESAGYRLQPGDVVFVSVWKETDLQAEVLVRPDGGMSFPLAGEQVAAGRTIEELRSSIEERLREYIPDPVVTVTIRQIGGNRVYVVGKVNRPGEFPISRPLESRSGPPEFPGLMEASV